MNPLINIKIKFEHSGTIFRVLMPERVEIISTDLPISPVEMDHVPTIL